MSIDLLRSPDDDLADAAWNLDMVRRYQTRLPQTIGDCPRCGIVETLLIGDLCHVCESEAAWSRDNRRLCDIIHGGHRP